VTWGQSRGENDIETRHRPHRAAKHCGAFTGKLKLDEKHSSKLCLKHKAHIQAALHDSLKDK